MASKPIELKPCPFCGGRAVRNNGHNKYIKCKKCGVLTRIYSRMSDATRAWNKRTCKKECKDACKK